MTRLETKCIERYFRRGFSGGRGAFARVADGVALRLILFAAAFLLLRPRTETRLTAVLCSVAVLLAASILLHLLRDLRYARYRARECARLRALLLEQKLILFEEDALERIARPLLLPHERCAPLLRAEPAGPDALLPYARAGLPYAVCAPAGFTREAEAFSASCARLRLVPKGALLARAADAGLLPDWDEVAAHILKSEARRAAARKKRFSKPFSDVAAVKYLACAGLLFLLSFFTRYALYCRMLSGLCVSLFAFSSLLPRTRAPRGGIE